MNNTNRLNALISIIVPVYNAENYIKDCVESILKQDYNNIELIIVDDGSTDNSAKIIDEYKNVDKRVNVIHQKNSGVSVARNQGLEVAKGEYVCFIDVDDFISEDYISYYYNLIIENDAEIALTPQPRRFNEETKKNKINTENDTVEIWPGEKAAMEMLYYNLVIAPWNKMISMNLINKYKIRFNTKLAYGEGFNFSVDSFQRANKVAVGHRKVYNYRVDNPSSAMTKFSMRLVDGSIEAQETIKNNLVNRTPELLRACRYANWHTYCDCFNTMIGCKVAKKYKEKYKKIKKVCKKEALCVLKAPVTSKEKIKGILYYINPYITAKIINHFRLRKFTEEENN